MARKSNLFHPGDEVQKVAEHGRVYIYTILAALRIPVKTATGANFWRYYYLLDEQYAGKFYKRASVNSLEAAGFKLISTHGCIPAATNYLLAEEVELTPFDPIGLAEMKIKKEIWAA